MKTLFSLLIACIFATGSIGCASIPESEGFAYAESHQQSKFTADGHLKKARHLENRMTALEHQTEKLRHSISMYENKPYLDNKGFKRSALNNVMSTKLQKIDALREHIAWHRAEAERLEAQEEFTEGESQPLSLREDERPETFLQG